MGPQAFARPNLGFSVNGDGVKQLPKDPRGFCLPRTGVPHLSSTCWKLQLHLPRELAGKYLSDVNCVAEHRFAIFNGVQELYETPIASGC